MTGVLIGLMLLQRKISKSLSPNTKLILNAFKTIEKEPKKIFKPEFENRVRNDLQYEQKNYGGG